MHISNRHIFLLSISIIASMMFSSCNLLFFNKESDNARIEINPANIAFAPGTTRQFTATRTSANGATENVSGIVIWSTSNPSVAHISSGGTVTALSPGNAAIGASIGLLAQRSLVQVVDPNTTPVPPEPISKSMLQNPDFDEPGYEDPDEVIPGGGTIRDFVPGWNFSISGDRGMFNIGVGKEAGSNYLYLGQEAMDLTAPVTMAATATVGTRVTENTVFRIRYKILDFDGKSNHSDMEYPIRVIVTIDSTEYYLFLRSSNTDLPEEKILKGEWQSAEMFLPFLTVPGVVDSKAKRKIGIGDNIERIGINPMGLHWKILVDYFDLFS
jgi:hypothetical protein